MFYPILEQPKLLREGRMDILIFEIIGKSRPCCSRHDSRKAKRQNLKLSVFGDEQVSVLFSI
jgi:hypothetical protein